MNDRMNESISALVDGEADELEVRRALNQLEQDEELRERWSRYQLMGALMREEPATTVDLSRGIMQAISGEPMDEVPARQTAAHEPVPAVDVAETEHSHSWRKRSGWIASGAVAASVTLAVLMSVRVMDGASSVQPVSVAAVDTPSLNVQSAESKMVAGSDIATDSAPTLESGFGLNGSNISLVSMDAGELSDTLTEEQLSSAQSRLHEYVMQHSEHAALNTGRGLMPFARVTSFEQGGDAQQ
ncbi:sigma-E factor negative regulatory protein [Oceanobacter sp. 3_MG-2023]|uniref:sigma-E factor negative regulatory protein n=1 Tax=Oceanobacter sp. 3_MG-2023 TaxID=3062622 RepID=UPI002734F4D6|nr:sigma-E factor negative regulatory protein [Oceanobacter sp. 3_MG-2023]MDP2506806.1 sigma-E factor negative regulatory protein [Oceanobacter sp. 3_MG-2023]